MATQLTTSILQADAEGLTTAAKLLQDGQTVAFPTETVYGLGADATNAQAVARIFEAKGRPSFNPLIVHVADLRSAQELVDLDGPLLQLAQTFWPGSLTLVAPMKDTNGIAKLTAAGLWSLAVRIPAHPLALRLLREVGRPIAAPSANPSGGISPTTADHVVAGLGGKIAAVVDGGPCAVGLESTIIGMSDGSPTLLRPGGLPTETIEATLEQPLKQHSGGISAPGQMASHYAPNARVTLNVTHPQTDRAHLAFGPTTHPHALTLSENCDLREAAANLFSHLHTLDEMVTRRDLKGLTVAPVPDVGLGRAINDRLARAAADRHP